MKTYQPLARRKVLAVVSCLALVCPPAAFSQTGAAVLAAGAGRGLNPALLGKALPPGTGVHVWLAHPAEEKADAKRDEKKEEKEKKGDEKAREKSPAEKAAKADPAEAEGIIRRILGPKASRRSVTAGTPPKRVDVWMSVSWAPEVPVEERAALISRLHAAWPHGVSVQLDAPALKAPRKKKDAGAGKDAALNGELIAKQIGAAVPPGFLGEWGGRKFDGAGLFGRKDREGPAVAGGPGTRTAEQAIADAKRAPRAAGKNLKIVEPAFRPYEGMIREEAEAAGVDPNVVHAVIRAKGGYGAKKKGGGAYGLMMVSRPAADWVRVQGDLMDPRTNVRAGTRVLAKLLKMFDGDVHRALAAYQAGAGTVLKSGGVPARADVRKFLGEFEKAYGGRAAPARADKAGPPVVPPAHAAAKGLLQKAGYALFGGPEGPARPGRSFAHTSRWKPIIERYAKRFGVDPALVESLMSIESMGGRYARSKVGAGGLMQLMPATARGLGVRDVYDPEQNIYGGVKYLSGLLKRFGGNPVLAVAAYNSGPGYQAYRRGMVPTIRETVGHVTKVFKRYAQLTGRVWDVKNYMSAQARKWSDRVARAFRDAPVTGAAPSLPGRTPSLPQRRPGLLRSMDRPAVSTRFPLSSAPAAADPRRGRSVGLPYSGRLADGVKLEPVGTGYRSIRQDRGRFYGTGRLVAGLEWAAAKMVKDDPAAPPLAVGDLSQRGGGRISHHKSHQNGTDVDLVYYWKDSSGKPVPAAEFVNLTPGAPRRYGGKTIYFDTERNWALVKNLVANPHFKVQWIFTSSAIRDALLRHARKTGESAAVIKAAAARLNVEGNHANHFHVRVH